MGCCTCKAIRDKYKQNNIIYYINIIDSLIELNYKMSMGIVGANSTAGRAVKCIDPSKTTKSESSWLGYTLCDIILYYY